MSASNDPKTVPPGGTEIGEASGLLADLRGSGDARSAGSESRVPSASKVSTQAVVFTIVLAISAGALYLMRRQGMGAGMTFQTVRIDHDFEKPQGTTAAQQRILDDLARSGSPSQVPVEKLPKNPFALVVAALADLPLDDSDAQSRRASEAARVEREKRQQAIAAALSGLVLNSVMEGPVPVARVNDQIVKIGDVVGEFFMVEGIHGRTIDLGADGKTYTLEMGDGGGRPGGPAKPRSR